MPLKNKDEQIFQLNKNKTFISKVINESLDDSSYDITIKLKKILSEINQEL